MIIIILTWLVTEPRYEKHVRYTKVKYMITSTINIYDRLNVKRDYPCVI